ncbi:MAG: hemolysin III family protein [Coriobacteriaceae bacterium]|nr:hemolysin III family protein [Coriobacteriaceae bacterium]MDO4890275.1 hemolysin III family protein [Coriobacteriaceae bacterium]
MPGLGARSAGRNVREYTIGEEIANSITHGIGALLAVAAIPITIVKAVGDGGGVLLFCALVYTIFMLFEYVASTLYHALRPDGAKRVFKVLDHSFIYLFIAASYTPYCLVTLADVGGWPLFFVVWALAIAGVAAEAFWVFRPRWVNAVLYLLLGWAVVWFIPALYALLPATGFWLLVAGGICYSIGCVFYVLKQVPYFHAIFHVFILAGTVLQYFSILLFVL